MLQVVVSIVLVGAIFWYVFRQFANISEVWAIFGELTWQENGLLAVAAIWNIVTYWIVLVVAMPGLTVPQAAVMNQATTAVSNSVPFGGAVGVGLTYTMLSSWGFSRSRTTMMVVVTGIWNNFIKLGMPIFALAILALQGQPGSGRITAALGGLAGLVGAIVVFALILRSEDFARRAGILAGRAASWLLRPVKRGPVHGWDLAVVKFRNRVIGLVQHRWHTLTLSALVSHVSLYAVLLATLRVVGVPESQATWAEVLALYAFARFLTIIPFTPGGVGVIELALIAGLVRLGGDEARVVAGVLLYRVLTYLLPILIGAVAYVYWRRNKSWRDSAPPLSPKLAQSMSGAAVNGAAHTEGVEVEGATADAVTARSGSPPRNRPEPVRRRWVDVIWLAVGVAVFALASLVARDGLAAGEAAVFSAINGLPDWVNPVIWPFMQYGVFVTIPVLIVIALILRRVRLAIALAVAGIGVYYLAKVVKEVVDRGRPGELIDGVVLRETFAQGSLGFPSGHAAVAAAVTVVATPYLRGWWRYVPAALLAIVFVGRIYVAAHVPLDLVGGAALGVIAGAIANLLVKVPQRAAPDLAKRSVPEPV